MPRILILIIMMTVYSFAISPAQLERMQIVANEAVKIHKETSVSYEKTILAIYLQESSAGLKIIGDKFKDSFYILSYKNGKKNRIYIKKNLLIKKDGKYHYIYQGFYKKVYRHIGRLKPLSESSLGGFQIKLDTAKKVIKHYNMKKYMNLSDTDLINKLLVNIKFSANIAIRYLIMCKNSAIRKKLSDPYLKSISRYNGGWKNMKYIYGYKDKKHRFHSGVLQKLKYVEKLIKQKKIILKNSDSSNKLALNESTAKNCKKIFLNTNKILPSDNLSNTQFHPYS